MMFNRPIRARSDDQGLTLDNIQRVAPSVFATEAWGGMSEKYRFVPTAQVVEGLVKADFVPVYAGQSISRTEGKSAFTRHVLRFRHRSLLKQAGETPEIVLLNSHDGSSSYQIDLGFFRTVCANGLIVKSASCESLRVRHSGKNDIVGEVIDASYKIIDSVPEVTEQIGQWKGLTLSNNEREAFAASALEVRDSALTITPGQVLDYRRYDDNKNDLWTTFNVVQENLIRGGIRGQDANNNSRRIRGIKSVDGDTKLNRALWSLTEKMAQLKMAA